MAEIIGRFLGFLTLAVVLGGAVFAVDRLDNKWSALAIGVVVMGLLYKLGGAKFPSE